MMNDRIKDGLGFKQLFAFQTFYHVIRYVVAARKVMAFHTPI